MDLFYRPVTDVLDLEAQEFDEKLGSDGLGRMAYLMRSATPVVNQMMETPCLSPFYGRVVSCCRWWGDPVFLMRQQAAKTFFPTEPLSLRRFAAAWVPVELSNTEAFSRASGWGKKTAKVFVSSDYVPGLSTFLKYVKLTAGRDFVASSDVKDVPTPKSIPFFRYNKAYNLDADTYAKVIRDGRFRPL